MMGTRRAMCIMPGIHFTFVVLAVFIAGTGFVFGSSRLVGQCVS